MSESSNSRIEVRECLRKANICNDGEDRWAWLTLARFWLLLAETQETGRERLFCCIRQPAHQAFRNSSGSLAVSAGIRRVVKFSEIERELVKPPRPHAWPLSDSHFNAIAWPVVKRRQLPDVFGCRCP